MVAARNGRAGRARGAGALVVQGRPAVADDGRPACARGSRAAAARARSGGNPYPSRIATDGNAGGRAAGLVRAATGAESRFRDRIAMTNVRQRTSITITRSSARLSTTTGARYQNQNNELTKT